MNKKLSYVQFSMKNTQLQFYEGTYDSIEILLEDLIRVFLTKCLYLLYSIYFYV